MSNAGMWFDISCFALTIVVSEPVHTPQLFFPTHIHQSGLPRENRSSIIHLELQIVRNKQKYLNLQSLS